MVIVRSIWQKLSNVERKVTLIVIDFWQLFPHIFGETEPGSPLSIHLFFVRPRS
jgi:hypothetical protein